MPKVLITHEVPHEHLMPLHGVAEIVQGPPPYDMMDRASVLDLASELHGIINQTELRVDAELLDAAPQLKIVANVAIGTDNLELDLMAERGIWATNTPEAPVESTADFTLAMLLALVRRIPVLDRYVRTGDWETDGFQPGRWDGVLLSGKTLGIIGYGRIGRGVARRARAFGMNVVVFDPMATSDPEYRPLEELLPQSDVVSMHVPLVDSTLHLMNAERFATMKPGALFLNMARGKVVDESALVAALQSGHVAGAGLDVFELEPKVHSDLLAMDQVLLSPHVGGGTNESKLAARMLCAENIAVVLDGKSPLTPVNSPKLT